MISDLTEARFKVDSETAALAILWTDTIGFSITAKLIDIIHKQCMMTTDGMNVFRGARERKYAVWR